MIDDDNNNDWYESSSDGLSLNFTPVGGIEVTNRPESGHQTGRDCGDKQTRQIIRQSAIQQNFVILKSIC